MQFVYRVLFNLFFCLSAPFYFLKMWKRGNWQRGFMQRFGRFDSKVKQAVTNAHVLWIHAVSVGEVNIAVKLISELESRLPNMKIVVSTTTSTGMGELRKRLPAHIVKIYYPIDRQPWAERALMTLHPDAIILVEAEIWPNFLWRARRRNIPTFLVNARFSDKSFKRYRMAGFIFKTIFRSFAGAGVQNEADAKRLMELGFRPEAVRVVGSMKFDDGAVALRAQVDAEKLIAQAGAPKKPLIIVGGSTHTGEDAILARAYKALKPKFPELFLVDVPRHQERGRAAAAEIEKEGLTLIFRSNITGNTSVEPGTGDCLLVNTTGELKAFYEIADIVFIGKSLSAKGGGQNPIEPAGLGKPILFGPSMENFPDIAPQFVEKGGAFQVPDEAHLTARLGELLSDAKKRETMGSAAKKIVKQNTGALYQTVEMIIEHLEDDEEIYVAPVKD